MLMKVTLELIARTANVSKATVSRVLNHTAAGVGEETRKRVQKVIDQLEYQPDLLARGISISKTKTIGLIVPDITNPFFAEVAQHVDREAHKRGYALLISLSDGSTEKEQECMVCLITKHVDGVILASQMPDVTQNHFRFQKYHIPCILIDRKMPQLENTGGVFVDNEYAFFEATEYLIQNRHRDIALIAGPASIATTKERIEGYRYAHHCHAIPCKKELITYGEFTMQTGRDAVYRFHEQNIHFSAVLAGNDTIAIGAISALKELDKKIPEEVEVIGYDNIEMGALIDPPLSTIEQPIQELSCHAVEMLETLIQKKALPQANLRLESKMIHRKTTQEFRKNTEKYKNYD